MGWSVPTKEPPVKFGFVLLQFQVALAGPPLEHRELLPTGRGHFQLFFLLGYKGRLHLVHFTEQPATLCPCSVRSFLCWAAAKGERPKSPYEVERQNQENPVGQKCSRRVQTVCGQSPSSSPLAACGFPDAKCWKCFGQDPSVDVPKGYSFHRVGSVWV